MSITQPSYLNADRRIIADLLAACPVGETVTYSDMTEALGASIEARRYLIPAAMKTALEETGAIFGCIRRVGYKRLPAQDAHIIGHATRRRIRRQTGRASKTILRAVAVGNDVSDEARRKAFAEISVLGLIQHLSRDTVVRAMPATEKAEPVAKTMRAMLDAIGSAA